MNPLLRKLLARVNNPDKVWRRIEKVAHRGSARCPSCDEAMAMAYGEGWNRRFACSICDEQFDLLWNTPMGEDAVGVHASISEWLDALARSICFGPRRQVPLPSGRNRPRSDIIRKVADEMVASPSPLVRVIFALRRLPDPLAAQAGPASFEESGVWVLPPSEAVEML